MRYEDGRFSNDIMWSFYASNFLVHRKNQSSGAFYVRTFFENGPKILSELKSKLSTGDTEWVERLSYFSKNVPGSSSFWCSKKRKFIHGLIIISIIIMADQLSS